MQELSIGCLPYYLLPTALRVLFLAYPTVTNVAFDAFSCFEFSDGRGWLVTDVCIPPSLLTPQRLNLFLTP